MSRTLKIGCLLLTVVMILLLPFTLPSGAMLEDEQMRLEEEMWAQEDTGHLIDLLLPKALAEAPATEPLPIDFSPGRRPNPALFTQDGYEDESITVNLQTLEEEGVVWRVAEIYLTHPSQLRTATAGGPRSNRVAFISAMAEKNNAIFATNANYMTNDPAKTSFEYRMGARVRAKYNNLKDLLITDENADLHIFTGQDKDAAVEAFQAEGHRIVNAFTFGPALVMDDVLQPIPEKYSYNPSGREPRLAFGQMGPLTYALVLAEGRTEDSQGATIAELGQFMFDFGCSQAFNFDGGNSATMVYNDGYYQNRTRDNERAQSDMLYFATLVDPASWQK